MIPEPDAAKPNELVPTDGVGDGSKAPSTADSSDAITFLGEVFAAAESGHHEVLGSTSSPLVRASSADLRRGKRRVAIALTVAAVAVLAILPMIFGGTAHPKPDGGAAPATLLKSASLITLAQRTADVVISGTMNAAGQKIDVTGTGQIDFTRGASAISMGFDVEGTHVSENELMVNRHMYFGMTANGSDIVFSVTGKHWAEMPLTTSAQSMSDNPASELQALAANGNTVDPLGTSTINGRSVTGYAVTLSAAAMQKNVQSAIVDSSLAPEINLQLQQIASQMAPPTIKVWFDSAGLIRRMGLAMNINSGSATVDMAVDMAVDMTFDHYGTPVTVKAPDAGDVVSYSELTQQLGNQSQ